MTSKVAAVLILGLAAKVFASNAQAQDACADPEISIEFGIEQPTPSARQFGSQIIEAIETVCQWWGPTYDGPITIYVQDYFGPSMALVPAWHGGRGHMLFAAPMVSRGRAATIHEITHVYAPNGNRFLAEGLAVFAHEHLGGPAAYPNFGADLHHLARRLHERANLLALDGLATPSRMLVSGLDEREAYIVAGSFVRFLVSEFGLERFREIYALTPLVPSERDAGRPERWYGVYGHDLAELERMWQDAVRDS